jgi:hypothetical protein
MNLETLPLKLYRYQMMDIMLYLRYEVFLLCGYGPFTYRYWSELDEYVLVQKRAYQ